MSIKKLDENLIKHIHSSHTIQDIVSVLKELFENSVDSGATEICIQQNDSGYQKIEITDNGCGINPDDLDKLCIRGATTKLSTYQDKENLKTVGFRGEALSAISQFAELIITSKVETSSEAYSIHFQKGKKQEKMQTIHKNGTTVTVMNQFDDNKIRRKNFLNNKTNYMNSIVDYLTHQSFLLLNKQVKVFNTVEKGGSQLIFNLKKSLTIPQAVKEVIGYPLSKILAEVNYDENEVKINGWMSTQLFSGINHIKPIPKKDQAFCYVNNRYIKPPKFIVSKLKDSYKQFNKTTRYFAILFIELDQKDIEVNVSTDKQEVIFGKLSNNLIAAQDTMIDNFIEELKSKSKCVDGTEQHFDTNKDTNELFVQTKFKVLDKMDSALENELPEDEKNDKQKRSSLGNFMLEYKKSAEEGNFFTYNTEFTYSQDKKEEKIENELPEKVSLKEKIREINPIHSTTEATPLGNNMILEHPGENENSNAYVERYESYKMGNHSKESSNSSWKSVEEDGFKFKQFKRKHPGYTDYNDDEAVSNIEPKSEMNMLLAEKNFKRIRPERNGIEGRQQSDYIVDDQPKIKDYIQKADEQNIYQSFKNAEKIFLENMVNNLSASEVNNQNVRFTKNNFTDLLIIGQFNKGFIISLFRESNNYYIIDQHAADEKFRYEAFMNSDKVKKPNCQELVIPMRLELGLADQHFFKSNISVFESLGFKILEKDKPDSEVNNQANEGQNFFTKSYQSFGKNFYIKTIPEIHGFKYGVEDFYDVLAILKNKPENKKVIFPKMLRDFASKSCRTAIMIGDSLPFADMKVVVDKMKGMQSPWYCPHGRPSTIVAPKKIAVSFNNFNRKFAFSV